MYKEIMIIEMVSPTGENKIINIENDVVLIILSIFELGWIKLLIDGRISSGITNILISYIPFAAIIHGIYLGIKPETHIKDMINKDYKAKTEADAEAIKFLTGIKVDTAK